MFGKLPAVLPFERESNYNREIKCYQILKGFQVSQIDGFNVPELIGFDDDLLAMEITVVSAPYILDFGKAYTHEPDYPSDAIEHDLQRCEDDFGESWPAVQCAIFELRHMGIWYVDAKPSNISCEGLKIE